NLLGICGSFIGVGLKAMLDQPLQGKRSLAAGLAQLTTSHIGQISGERFVNNYRTAVKIGTRIDCLAGQLFRRHVTRRAQNGTGPSKSMRIAGYLAAPQHAGNAEIQHTQVHSYAALAQQKQIVRLNIPMDDPLAMRMNESKKKLFPKLGRGIDGKA